MAEPKVEPAEEPVADPLPPEPSPAPEQPDEGAPKVEEPAPEPEAEPLSETRMTELTVDPSDVTVRSVTKRELDVRLLPWDMTIETTQGPEEFRRGATVGTPDDGVLLMGLEHEAHIGLGQNGQPILTRRPAGRSMRVWEEDDGPHVTFRVARTQAGDEILALAEDRIVRGVSLEFAEVPGGTSTVARNGRRVRVHNRVALRGASMTYRPAYGEQAAVLAVRSHEQKTEIAPMAETQEVPVNGAEIPPEMMRAAVAELSAAFDKPLATLMDRIASLEERNRLDLVIPNAHEEEKQLPSRGEWTETVIKILTGDRVPDAQYRLLADVITSDNAGVVPPAYLTELIGVIDTSRPFLSTTRRLPTPASGMQIIVPVITQRPLTGIQSPEKEEVVSQKTIIGTESFDAISIAGAGDISIQVLKRSSRSFLDLWLELLAEAYAIDAEDVAITALLNAMGGVGSATALNPEDLNLGAAFVSSFDAIRRPPDTIWLSTQAVGEFIDAKASTTNAPLYPGLAASATAAGGITGVVSGLRPVHVPTLDAHGAYAIVGPSSGFAWAEDGTYTLQVDVPSKAGRDVGLIGMIWPMPWYPAAFTAYNVAS